MFTNKSSLMGLAVLCLLAGSSLAITNCKSEGYDQAGYYVCSQCYTGYYLSSTRTQCLSCPSSCSSCIAYNSCQACSSGYFLNGVSCSSCSSGCSSCTNYNSCQSCKSGYYYISLSLSCGTCISNCNTCYDSKTCSSCAFTYEKKTDNMGYDSCNATAGTAIMFILIVIGIILCIPVIICCFCWASIAQCFGWRSATTYNIHSGPDNGASFDPGYYAQPANPGFQHHQPAGNMGQPFPGQPGNPAYGNQNAGMPWGR